MNRLYLLYREENINLPGINQMYFSMNGLYDYERIILYGCVIVIIMCMIKAYKISKRVEELKIISPKDIKFYKYIYNI